MRLTIALSSLAGGLLLGWAALAQAQAAPHPAPQAAAPPPAAPIFYCPSMQAGPAKAAASVRPAPAAHAACPTTVRVAAVARRRRWRRHRHEVVAAWRDNGVSESQAFIYRYERALHGLNAQAAEEAWGRPPPPCLRGPHAGCPTGGPTGYWAYGAAHRPVMAPPPVLAQQAPPPRRLLPPHLGCPQACPPAPPPPAMAMAQPVPPPAPAYAWRDQRAPVHAWRYERREEERSSGWRYSEEDGHGRFERWGDGVRRAPCPRAPEAGCAAALRFRAGERQWRDGSYGQVYQVAGRDAYGYLVWPGKTPPQDVIP